ERLGQGIPEIGGSALEVDHGEVILDEETLETRPCVNPPLPPQRRDVVGVNGHVTRAVDEQGSLGRQGRGGGRWERRGRRRRGRRRARGGGRGLGHRHRRRRRCTGDGPPGE